MQSFSDPKRIPHPAAKPDQKLALSAPARRKRAGAVGEGPVSPDFITALSEMEGVASAVLVSYNGDYLG